MKILLTGATGYVGKSLLPLLIEQGHEVRCLVRSPDAANAPKASTGIEVVQGDATQVDTLVPALQGCQVAYYFIHSMDGSGEFAARDRICAENFKQAASTAGLEGIIYLSGLANSKREDLSEHLKSRQEVGRILRSGSVPCTEFRAAMVIGDGSLSFKMVMHLCHRLPIMICPKWLSTPTQPIAIGDLLQYLIVCLPLAKEGSQVVEVGGRDQTTMLRILREYCRQRGLRRFMVPVPLLSPKLSSHWLALVTPETAEVGKSLVDGLRHPTVVRNGQTAERFGIQPCSMSEAIAEALAHQEQA